MKWRSYATNDIAVKVKGLNLKSIQQVSIFALNNGKPLSIHEKSYVFDDAVIDLYLLNKQSETNIRF